MAKKIKTHVSEEKKGIVKELGELMEKKTIIIASIKSLPDAQFQDIKKKLRGKAIVKVAKKNLIKRALEQAKDENLKKLLEHINADYVLIFSDEDAFELSGILADNKSSAKAKEGQEAVEDIKVEAGPTSLMAGPDISTLSSAGLKPKIEGGKISIQESYILVKKGDVIKSNIASILAKLDIAPFKIGIEPLVAFSEGKIYLNVRIDREGTLKDLGEKFGRALAFAVLLDYFNSETIPFILGKAGMQERALSDLIKTQETKSGEEK